MVSWVFGFVDARSRRLFLFHTFNYFVSSVSGLQSLVCVQSRVCSVSWAFILVGPSVSRTSRFLSLPCPILFFLRTLSTKSVKPGRKIRHHFLHPKDLDSKFPVGHRLRCYCHKRFLHCYKCYKARSWGFWHHSGIQLITDFIEHHEWPSLLRLTCIM